MSETPRRRPLQFSLRTMFLAITIIAVPVAFVAWVTHAMKMREQRRAAPLTDDDLYLITRGTFDNAAIEPFKTRFVKAGNNTTKVIGSVSITDDGELDRLILALVPIKVVSPGSLPAGTADYQLSFQGGMAPTFIYVRIVGDALEFEVRGFVYQGGDAKAFRESAEIIIEREMQSSAEQRQNGVQGRRCPPPGHLWFEAVRSTA